jgi:hypothetical protein
MATATLTEHLILAHDLTPCGPIPTAHDPNGVYPYVSFCATAPRATLRSEPLVVLQNAHLRAEILPAQGGKVRSLTLLAGAEGPAIDVLAAPSVQRPARIQPRQAFCGGGIELSFPISHTPSLLERVHCEVGVGAADGRAYCVCGERELRHGMQWTVEWSLEPAGRALLQRARFFNPTAVARPWMSWSNAGVPSAPDTEFHYPPGRYLRHGAGMEEVEWQAAGPRRQGDISAMVGYFWRPPPPPLAAAPAPAPEGGPPLTAFGVFTPSRGAGLYHVSSLPGVKLWSDGVGQDERWVTQYQADCASQLVEMQAGPLADQGVKAVLQPGAQHVQEEAWLPSRAALPLGEAAEAARSALARLRALPALPLFSWARPATVQRWLALQAEHAGSGAAAVAAGAAGAAGVGSGNAEDREGAAVPSPAPATAAAAAAAAAADAAAASTAAPTAASALTVRAPDEASLEWAPSGMEGLGRALAWAAAQCPAGGEEESRWLFQLGAWLAATAADGEAAGAGEEAEERRGGAGLAAALAALRASRDGRARALLGRLLRRCCGDAEGAAAALAGVAPRALALHPQVVVERDLALAGLGAAALPARRAALEATAALEAEDEGLAERRVALLADEGRGEEALALLLARRFSLVHQRYVRTALWRRLVGEAQAAASAPPASLGEDALFGWGAYFEFTGQ